MPCVVDICFSCLPSKSFSLCKPELCLFCGGTVCTIKGDFLTSLHPTPTHRGSISFVSRACNLQQRPTGMQGAWGQIISWRHNRERPRSCLPLPVSVMIEPLCTSSVPLLRNHQCEFFLYKKYIFLSEFPGIKQCMYLFKSCTLDHFTDSILFL